MILVLPEGSCWESTIPPLKSLASEWISKGNSEEGRWLKQVGDVRGIKLLLKKRIITGR